MALVIQENKASVFVRDIPMQYRANCSSDWGLFVHGDTSKLSSREAEKQGLTKGTWVEMAICWLSKKYLTFKPNYINEEFLEIWGIPVKGEMKDQYPDQSSEISTFLIHRQSKDAFEKIISDFEGEAFKQWLADGAKGDGNTFVNEHKNQLFFTKIFRFEMTKTESDYGMYHFVNTTYREPNLNSDWELSALQLAAQVYQRQIAGDKICYNSRIENNNTQTLIEMGEIDPNNLVALQPTVVEPENPKRIKAAK